MQRSSIYVNFIKTALIVSVAIFIASASNAQIAPPTIDMVFVEGDSVVESFSIGKYEVTQGQWKAIMGDNPSYFKNGDNYPVDMVNIDDIEEFIDKLNSLTGKNYRLPTMIEWNYAALGGNKGEGYDIDEAELVKYKRNSNEKKTYSIGSFPPNKLGIYDMFSDMQEWTEDNIVQMLDNESIKCNLVRNGCTDASNFEACAGMLWWKGYVSSSLRERFRSFRLVHPL